MRTMLLALSVCFGLTLASNGASATPLANPGSANEIQPTSNVETVHWRGYYHCHRGRHGRRFCHGGRGRGPYWGRPYRRGHGPHWRHHHRGPGPHWDRPHRRHWR
jgi:hypothetical protein